MKPIPFEISKGQKLPDSNEISNSSFSQKIKKSLSSLLKNSQGGINTNQA